MFLKGRLRQEDYDVIVTNRMGEMVAGLGAQRTGPDGHLFVVSFVPGENQRLNGGTADVCRGQLHLNVFWGSNYLAKPVEIPDDVLVAAQDLIIDDLVPVARARQSRIYVFTVASPADKTPEDLFVPHAFLRTGGKDKRILAAWYRRSTNSEGWVLPSDLKRPGDWVAAAFRHWALTYRRFPLVGGWWEDPAWQTLQETITTKARSSLVQDLVSHTARMEQEIATATAALEAAQLGAAVGARRLLTEKGEPLTQATIDALRRLGYTVTDRDQEEKVDAGGKGEDLGVVDPDDATFDPIIEVKGYDSGAKVGDFGKLMRHYVRAKAAGRSPSAIWWIMNHWRSRPPAERGAALAGEDSFISEHAAEEVPLVIVDSRDLFRAMGAVEEGQIVPSDVRRSLQSARGRWEGVTPSVE